MISAQSFALYIWRVDLLVFIPGFLEEDTADTVLCKIESVRYMIIDHEADLELFTESRFRLRVCTIVIHEVDSIFWYFGKIVMYPTESLLFFYRIVSISCCDDRVAHPLSSKNLDTLSRKRNDRGIFWSSEGSAVPMPEVYSIFSGEGEAWVFEDIMIREVRSSLTHQELPLSMSIPEKSSKCACQCLIEIESDMGMCSPVELVYMHMGSIEKNAKQRNKKKK